MSSRTIILGLAILAVLGALGGFGAYVRALGYQDGVSDAQRACERQRRETEEANRQAVTEAQRELMRAADRLSLDRLETDNALAGIDNAATADPDAGRECLGAGSVQRLNTIR